ncbi:MAG: hypothetical protein H0X37_14675 [Herpetosiphonaceae bacterium]|nr:hypothetical protein [Herpetosiphonaceae bacterium]
MTQELLHVQAMDLEDAHVQWCPAAPRPFWRSKSLLLGNDPHPSNQHLPVRDVAAVVLRVGRPPGR